MEFYSPKTVAPNSIAGLMAFIKNNVKKGQRLCDTPGLVDQLMGLRANIPDVLDSIMQSLQHPEANSYGKNSFVLYRDDTLMLRAVVWEPRADSDYTKDDANLFAYGLCHDHNFELLTLGLSGSGYTTHMYEYQHKGSDYEEGEEIDIHFNGDFVLEKGCVLYMDKSQDLHSQSPPKELSMSLNIIMDSGKKEQPVFVDTQSKRVISFGNVVDGDRYMQQLQQALS
ncbi:hypothetical protein L1285_13060 [Pseudoalteromonas sp. DL2-H2.2]|uniref:hypothetical protein n=1 Tax=Pseudoalteromonas sp. DL2-H2.2 TaxID=2908889 RepID=UPI001F2BE937|nr:hypothetical protein [Pseudoalteromonas sp. DL2-H2.2]MCF2909251.1 hypothetical protein [Pseudoalteromonas sp. DL2-H2.2]